MPHPSTVAGSVSAQAAIAFTRALEERAWRRCRLFAFVPGMKVR